MWLLTKSKSKASSRRQIDIKEVKDGTLVLSNQEYRVIIETSSVNLELKSEDEQDVLIDSFQNFLNSLSVPVQILIRVREVDINSYLEKIKELKKHEKQKVYKTQIDNYTGFVSKLVSGNKILQRRFYVILPYQNTDNKNDFNQIKEHIFLQRDIIIRALEKLGMKTKILDSLEILDLFYGFYNPLQAKTQPLQKQILTDNTYV